MFISITLKSKNRNSILKFLKILKNFSNNKKLQLNRKLIIQQNKDSKKVFTVLKSPHVNKTAQEQYEFKLFSKRLKVDSFQIIKSLIAVKKIQTILFSDVQLYIKFNINDIKKKRKLVNRFHFNENLFKINKCNLEFIELHLLIYYYYGKYKFTGEFK